MPSIFDLVGAIGRKADTASSTGTAHAKLKQLLTDLGLQADTASATGSANAKLAALLPYITGSTSAPIVRPSLADPIVLSTHANPWTYGGYTEIVAASGLASHSLIGLVVTAVGQDDEYQVKVATGGAGSEADIATFVFRTISGEPSPVIMLPYPVQVPANARVAGASASDLGGASATVYLMFAPRPVA